MFESSVVQDPAPMEPVSVPAAEPDGTGAGAGALDVDGLDVQGLLDTVLSVLPVLDVRGLGEPALVDVIAGAESVKNALAGLQARAEVVLDQRVRARQEAAG
ncbi:hypothetical protein, partial [Arthrobacter sp.]|uniref:hypothetical protein n=1 Tax=Arthrobacter sp. TaxID=1667 RepID=UPI003A8FD077